MPDLKTIGPPGETTRSPVDGTEYVRLATPGANWKTTVSALVSSVARLIVTPSTPGYDGSLPGLHLYVNASTGSDSNDGISPATPFLTIQHGLNVLAEYDYGGQYEGDLEVADGTYTEALILPTLLGAGGGELFSTNGSGVTTIALNVGASPQDEPIRVGPLTEWRLSGFTVIAATSDDGGVVLAGQASMVTFGSDMVYDLSNMNAGAPAFNAITGGHIGFAADFSVTGSPLDAGSSLFGVAENGCIALDDVPVVCTFVGTPTIPDIVYGQSEGIILFTLGFISDLTFSGAVGTGTRKYNLTGGSQIITSISEASWPGDVAGVTDTWSHYDDIFRIVDSGTGFGVELSAPTLAADWEMTLPIDAGANGYVLSTDGSGVTSWEPAASGSGSPGGATDSVQYNAGSGNFGGATNLSIDGFGQPNVTAGAAYVYDGSAILSGVPASGSLFVGPTGNFTASGVDNVCIGRGCGTALTTGNQNIFIGKFTGQHMTSGAINVGLGSNALVSSTTTTGCFAMGQSTMSSGDGATDTIAIGTNSIPNFNSGCVSNIGIGPSTMAGATVTNSRNIAIGDTALYSGGTGQGNVAIGYIAFLNLAGGSNNTAIGYRAGQGPNGTEGSNTFIGALSALAAVGCNHSVGIGDSSLFNLGAADYNVAVGSGAGQNLSTGGNNTLLGANTGVTDVTTGANNIQIGYNVSVASATSSNQLCIGNYIYGIGLSGTVTTISSGKIGIGIKVPNFNLDVAGSLGSNEAAFILHSSTSITGGGTTSVPTLLTGPRTGDPTKWLPYDDNGTTRYIPSW